MTIKVLKPKTEPKKITEQENPTPASTSTAATPQKVSITHVKQMHMPPKSSEEMITDDMIEHIACSQYGVIKTILANPEAIVVKEGLTEDYTPSTKHQMLAKTTQIILPLGIPDDYSKLTPLQKKFLADLGGAEVLFFLNKLTHIYKAITVDDDKRISSIVRGDQKELTSAQLLNRILKPEISLLVFGEREKLALTLAKKAALLSKKNHVLLIFGSKHNFKTRIQEVNDPEIEYKGSVETDNLYFERLLEKVKMQPASNYKKSLTIFPTPPATLQKPVDFNESFCKFGSLTLFLSKNKVTTGVFAVKNDKGIEVMSIAAGKQDFISTILESKCINDILQLFRRSGITSNEIADYILTVIGTEKLDPTQAIQWQKIETSEMKNTCTTLIVAPKDDALKRPFTA
jgi:hypothetical protein